MNKSLEDLILKTAYEKGLGQITEFCVCSGVSLIEAYEVIQKSIDKKIEDLVDFYE